MCPELCNPLYGPTSQKKSNNKCILCLLFAHRLLYPEKSHQNKWAKHACSRRLFLMKLRFWFKHHLPNETLEIKDYLSMCPSPTPESGHIPFITVIIILLRTFVEDADSSGTLFLPFLSECRHLCPLWSDTGYRPPTRNGSRQRHCPSFTLANQHGLSGVAGIPDKEQEVYVSRCVKETKLLAVKDQHTKYTRVSVGGTSNVDPIVVNAANKLRKLGVPTAHAVGMYHLSCLVNNYNFFKPKEKMIVMCSAGCLFFQAQLEANGDLKKLNLFEVFCSSDKIPLVSDCGGISQQFQGIVVGIIEDLAKQGSVSFAFHDDARRKFGRQVDTALRSSGDSKNIVRLAFDASMAMQRQRQSDYTFFPELGIDVSEVTDAELADFQDMEIGTLDKRSGVVFLHSTRRYRPSVSFGGKKHYLGTYKTFEEAKLVRQKVKCQMRKEGKTPETYRHGVFPALGVSIRGMPDFGEGELDRSFCLRRVNKTRGSIPYAGVNFNGKQKYEATIFMPGKQQDSGKKYLGTYDTALQAAQVRQKVKTVLEQRGDLTPAGVFPEHGVDIRGLRDFAPESLSLSTNRNRLNSKNYSKYKYVYVTREGGAQVIMPMEGKKCCMGTYRTELEAAQVVRKILYRTRNETWRTEAETRQRKWY